MPSTPSCPVVFTALVLILGAGCAPKADPARDREIADLRAKLTAEEHGAALERRLAAPQPAPAVPDDGVARAAKLSALWNALHALAQERARTTPVPALTEDELLALEREFEERSQELLARAEARDWDAVLPIAEELQVLVRRADATSLPAATLAKWHRSLEDLGEIMLSATLAAFERDSAALLVSMEAGFEARDWEALDAAYVEVVSRAGLLHGLEREALQASAEAVLLRADALATRARGAR